MIQPPPALELDKMDTSTTSTDSQNQASTSMTTSTDDQNDLANTSTNKRTVQLHAVKICANISILLYGF